MYIVLQKIKAFGLEAGDAFVKHNEELFCRSYKNGSKICVPEFLLSSHPEWFKEVDKADLVSFIKSRK